MILNSLVSHYEMLHENGNAPDFGWAYVDVYQGVLLDENGQLLDIVPLGSIEQIGKRKIRKGYRVIAPLPVVRSRGENADFLYGNPSYLFGIEARGKISEAKFCAAKERHLEVIDTIQSPFAKAICRFFKTWDIELAADNPLIVREMKTIEQGKNMVFMMAGTKLATEDEELQHQWNKYFKKQRDKNKQICLVSGMKEPIARIHGKIKNVPGAQSAGANLVSVNAEAFASYNLADTMPGAPIGEYSAFAYVTALNCLLEDKRRHVDLLGLQLMYWVNRNESKMEEKLTVTLSGQSSSEDESLLEEMFKKIELAEPMEEIDLKEPFYILGIRPNSGRVSVAIFLEKTYGEILNNIKSHYERLEIVGRKEDENRILYPEKIIREAIKPSSKKNQPKPQETALMTDLMHSILEGARYPRTLYENVIMCIRAQQEEKKDNSTKQKSKEDVQFQKTKRKVKREQAAIIKACLLQYLPENERECITVALNPQSTNKPYILGRIFAVLEATQKKANPDVNTTIKDRFFNSACSNPNIAFPQIFKLFETHISKLRKNEPGYATFFQKQVQELLSTLEVEENPFPKTMGLNDQGLFILGYYQQTQASYTKKEKEEE